jgi:hypothetical protein
MLYIKLHKLVFASLVILLVFHAESNAAPQAKRNTSHDVPHKVDIGKNAKIRIEQENMRACQSMKPGAINAPRITVSQVKQSSSFKGGKYRVEGVIDGVCIREAGLYENGERIFKFPLTLSPFYKRYDFSFEVVSDKAPEVRAFDINWQRASKMLLKDKK